MMNAIKPLAFVAAALLSTAALAGGDKGSMKSADEKFTHLDSNQDSQISKTEAAQDSKLQATFASVDQNSDGYVSKSEYTAQMQDDDSERSSERYQ
jgi:hypothetical protein